MTETELDKVQPLIEIQKRLSAVQAELKVPKNNYNSFGKYSFRSAEDILEAVKPLCIKQGLLLNLTDTVVNIGGSNYVQAMATVRFSTEFVGSDGWARESVTKKGMDDSQITGSASSYARKYALNGLFAIDDTKDADTNEHHTQTGTTSPLATQMQREAIKRRLEKMGIVPEEMNNYLSSEYDVTPPLTKADAAKIMERMMESDTR